MAALRQQLGALTVKREERERYIAQHCAILHPIRVLPDEILRGIFDHCIPECRPFPDRNAVNFMAAEEAPMLLTFVCRRWRQVALDYSSLWDSPYVSLPLPLQDKGRWSEMARKTAKLSSLWFSRARNRPIRLTLTSTPSALAAEGLNDILQAVVAHSARWHTLHLQVADQLLDIFLSLPSTAVPNLQRLNLSIFYRQTKDIPALFKSDNLIGGPSIREIFLHGTQLCDRDSTYFLGLPIRWCQITHLDVPFITLEDVDLLHLFSETPSLQSGSFNISQCRLLDPRPLNNRITLTDLGFLALICQGKVANFIASLHLPQLMGASLATDENGDSLVAIAQAAPESLRYLSIQSKIITSVEVARCLALTPELRSLDLRYFPYRGPYIPMVTDDLFARLTPRFSKAPPFPLNGCDGGQEGAGPCEGEETWVCPHLHTIKVHVATGPRVTDTAIFEFIKGRRSRWPGVLRDVNVIEYRHDAEMDVLAELEKAGVDIKGMTINLQYRKREPEGASALDL
jgi:hypothetical protein